MTDEEVLEEIFFKQIRENEKGHVWYEITYEDSQRLKEIIERLLKK